MAEDTDKLRYLIASLPKELYDQIYEETFTAAPGFQIVSANKDDKSRFPELSQMHLLGVDRTSRALIIPSYYANTTFIVYDVHTCEDWAKSMPLEQFQMVKDIRCVSSRGAPGGDCAEADIQAFMEAVGAEMSLGLLALFEDLPGRLMAGSHAAEPTSTKVSRSTSKRW